ncbi:MAG TPA: right-handed parallel beta-helix repeat-containing protein, partial [Longimicrobium sp.]|nr:right-handed parallel beta-helix repeat-containing protein [Longimicrobium sp.]
IYGAIRVRDGSNVTIAHNQIGAGWTSGISLTNVFDSQVDHNRIDGTLNAGIAVAEIVSLPVSLRGVSFTGNQISNAGTVAMRIARACENTFTGNNVQDNAQGAVLLPSTGANVWRGNPGAVQDLGAFDCDHDGDIDPNEISGARSTSAASAITTAASPAFGSGHGNYPGLQ